MIIKIISQCRGRIMIHISVLNSIVQSIWDIFFFFFFLRFKILDICAFGALSEQGCFVTKAETEIVHDKRHLFCYYGKTVALTSNRNIMPNNVHIPYGVLVNVVRHM